LAKDLNKHKTDLLFFSMEKTKTKLLTKI